MNILLTGGTRGLGRSIAQSLLQRGDHVWILARDSESAARDWPADWPAECEPTWRAQMHWVQADLSDTAGLKAALTQRIDGKAIPFDGLVNNAAIAYDDLVTNLSMDELENSFQVNVFAPMELTRFVIRNMLLHRRGGSLVHISSICSRTGYKGLAMYGATKGAMEAFSKGVAREWGSKGIRSNCVLPGFMETDMSGGLSVEQREKIYQRTSLRQPTSLSSVASTVCFLLSDASQSITGQDLIIDAGSL
ncbi:SDR family NAD(P)-dependent oxidoreductase [Pirellulaceae bacterium SH467]